MNAAANDPTPRDPSSTIARASNRRSGSSAGWILAAGFACLAVAFATSSPRVNVPIQPAVSVDPEELVVKARRVAMRDPASIVVEGAPQTCNGCHQIFDTAAGTDDERSFHAEIKLNHGLNDRCANCHADGDLERLKLHDGSTVPFEETPTLCSQCHGTVFRDWQRGTHGKTLGSWLTGSLAQHRLNCNECHDPHAPRYEPYVPLAAPNTLRMGEQNGHGGDAHAAPATKRSPLQRWLDRPAAPSAEKNHNGGGTR
jgi:hypothetical protein